MKVLVTGAAGFIGSNLAERLLQRGDEVLGIDNFDPYYDPALKRANVSAILQSHQPPKFALIEADITDLDHLVASLEGHDFDAIVHLAAKVGIAASLEDPLGYASTNVAGTQVLLRLARMRGVLPFVFGSSSSVYGSQAPLPFAEGESALTPLSPYAATKRAGELLCEAHQRSQGGGVYCLRFFSVYGPRQRPDLVVSRFFSQIAAGQPVTIYGDGSAERDFTWVGDVVGGIIAALDRAGRTSEFEIINLGAGRSTTLTRLLELIAAALNQPPTVRHAQTRRGDLPRTLASLERARQLLGFEPEIEIEEGIRRLAPLCDRYHVAASRLPPLTTL